MVDRTQFPVGTYVEDREGNRGYTTDPPVDTFSGITVRVRWTEVLTGNTAEGATSLERIDNLKTVR